MSYGYSGGTDWGPVVLTIVIIVVVLAIGVLGMWGCPQYNVYQKTLKGQAELKQAEWNRQILIQEAEAKALAAEHWAEAEVARAKGAAQANSILSESLGGSEGYLRWLYIQMLEDTDNNLIYVPTEANLPILEAGRLQ